MTQRGSKSNLCNKSFHKSPAHNIQSGQNCFIQRGGNTTNSGTHFFCKHDRKWPHHCKTLV